MFTYYRADCILCDSEDDPLWLSPGPREINTGMAKFHENDLKCFGEQISLKLKEPIVVKCVNLFACVSTVE